MSIKKIEGNLKFVGQDIKKDECEHLVASLLTAFEASFENGNHRSVAIFECGDCGERALATEIVWWE